MVPTCPICDSSLAGHSFAALAEAGNEADMRILLSTFEAKEWEQLLHIHSFDVTKNAICANAVKCPTGAGFTVAFISYQELYSHDELAARSQALDAVEWASLTRAFQNVDWHSI
jgi:hypothetical protein